LLTDRPLDSPANPVHTRCTYPPPRWATTRRRARATNPAHFSLSMKRARTAGLRLNSRGRRLCRPRCPDTRSESASRKRTPATPSAMIAVCMHRSWRRTKRRPQHVPDEKLHHEDARLRRRRPQQGAAATSRRPSQPRDRLDRRRGLGTCSSRLDGGSRR